MKKREKAADRIGRMVAGDIISRLSSYQMQLAPEITITKDLAMQLLWGDYYPHVVKIMHLMEHSKFGHDVNSFDLHGKNFLVRIYMGPIPILKTEGVPERIMNCPEVLDAFGPRLDATLKRMATISHLMGMTERVREEAIHCGLPYIRQHLSLLPTILRDLGFGPQARSVEGFKVVDPPAWCGFTPEEVLGMRELDRMLVEASIMDAPHTKTVPEGMATIRIVPGV